MWKKLIKQYSNFIFVFIIFTLSILYIKQCNQTKEYKELAKTKATTINTAAEIVKKYTDADSNEHTVYKPNIITQDDLKREVDSSTLSLIDSLSDQLKIAKNTITDITRVKSTIHTITKGTKVDTVYKYSGPNLDWTFDPSTTELDYKADIRLNSVGYNDAKKFLGIAFNAKNLYTDIWWEDKNIKINSVDRIIVTQNIPQNSFKASAKSEYRFLHNTILTGPSVEINLNRFNFEGSYMYNYNLEKWEPAIGVKYHIIK